MTICKPCKPDLVFCVESFCISEAASTSFCWFSRVKCNGKSIYSRLKFTDDRIRTVFLCTNNTCIRTELDRNFQVITHLLYIHVNAAYQSCLYMQWSMQFA